MDKSNDSLDWLAFRLATGELAPDEVEAFFVRLADDEQAQQALARATQLVEQISAAERVAAERAAVIEAKATQKRTLPAAGSQHSEPAWRLTAIAVGLAATLAVAITWYTLRGVGNDRGGAAATAPGMASAEMAALAQAWDAVRQTPLDLAGDLSTVAVAEEEVAESPAAPADEVVSDDGAENWMLAALTGMKDKSDDLDSPDDLFPQEM